MTVDFPVQVQQRYINLCRSLCYGRKTWLICEVTYRGIGHCKVLSITQSTHQYKYIYTYTYTTCTCTLTVLVYTVYKYFYRYKYCRPDAHVYTCIAIQVGIYASRPLYTVILYRVRVQLSYLCRRQACTGIYRLVPVPVPVLYLYCNTSTVITTVYGLWIITQNISHFPNTQ